MPYLADTNIPLCARLPTPYRPRPKVSLTFAETSGPRFRRGRRPAPSAGCGERRRASLRSVRPESLCSESIGWGYFGFDVRQDRRTEGPAVLPGKGVALVKVTNGPHLAGPTGQSFLCLASWKENGWPVGPKMRDSCDTSTRAVPFAGRTDGLSARTN